MNWISSFYDNRFSQFNLRYFILNLFYLTPYRPPLPGSAGEAILACFKPLSLRERGWGEVKKQVETCHGMSLPVKHIIPECIPELFSQCRFCHFEIISILLKNSKVLSPPVLDIDTQPDISNVRLCAVS
jgi:hypothetical protein